MAAGLLHDVAGALGFAGRPYGAAGAALLVLYVIQSEVRFGASARSSRAGATDRRSSLTLSLAAAVPVLGWAAAMKLAPAVDASQPAWTRWLFSETLPGMPAIAWAAAAAGVAGLALRLWAVLKLRERYTRTLLTQENHTIERGGPYRFIRHPGYLGSLLCLNAIATTSGAAPVVGASLLATIPAYLYRVRVEDAMLVAALGAPYAQYRREVGGLLPFLR
ncbi:isoprenylcysteine carboxylmethyltransferase family protein [Phenylobacterium sp.]|jgi:protein-S-isoprenylcysteine O-methyltransferase|uniref:methyltransferase family protein n=1 Tax=Phenylobacterium sp. TaxID=1871053 RepID=UPI002F4102B7